MQKFETINEMVEAYKEEYNSGYSALDKHFSTQDVIDVCVTTLVPPAAKFQYGIIISRPTNQIENFGYVAAKDTALPAWFGKDDSIEDWL